MIRVNKKPEPFDFDEKVRQPGKKWLASPKHANANPNEYKDYWRKCIPELAEAYGHMCAYLAVYFDSAFGADSVDHFIPKSDPKNGKRLAYEWDNYRLSCLGENRKKNDKISPIDPFTMQPDSFFIDFSNGKIVPNNKKPFGYVLQCADAIKKLKLNDEVYCKMRKNHYLRYVKGIYSSLYLQSDSPFVWSEICRQGLKK